MFSDKQPDIQRTLSETEVQNDELLSIWERICSLNGKTITVLGEELKLIKIFIMEECDMRILFATQRWIKSLQL
jgi:hypothetical protein